MNNGDVIWNAIVMFDASCQRHPPFEETFSVRQMVTFNALRLGMMLNQMKFLVEQLNLWARLVT